MPPKRAAMAGVGLGVISQLLYNTPNGQQNQSPLTAKFSITSLHVAEGLLLKVVGEEGECLVP